MLEDVKQRLASLGYTATGADDWPLGFVIQKVENRIKSDCGVLTVPEGLSGMAIDMAVGEFLLAKKNTGQSVGIDVSSVLAAIQEGDGKVEYAKEATPAQMLDALISYLIDGRVSELSAFRCIKW